MRTMLIVILGCLMATAIMAHAQEKTGVKYCKDGETGSVFVVPANMPCPAYTHEL